MQWHNVLSSQENRSNYPILLHVSLLTRNAATTKNKEFQVLNWSTGLKSLQFVIPSEAKKQIGPITSSVKKILLPDLRHVTQDDVTGSKHVTRRWPVI